MYWTFRKSKVKFKLNTAYYTIGLIKVQKAVRKPHFCDERYPYLRKEQINRKLNPRLIVVNALYTYARTQFLH